MLGRLGNPDRLGRSGNPDGLGWPDDLERPDQPDDPYNPVVPVKFVDLARTDPSRLLADMALLGHWFVQPI